MTNASKTRNDREHGRRDPSNTHTSRTASRRYAAADGEKTRDDEEAARDDDETQTACIIRSHEKHAEAHYPTSGEDG